MPSIQDPQTLPLIQLLMATSPGKARVEDVGGRRFLLTNDRSVATVLQNEDEAAEAELLRRSRNHLGTLYSALMRMTEKVERAGHLERLRRGSLLREDIDELLRIASDARSELAIVNGKAA